MIYSQDNWFGWGYDHSPFTFRTSELQKLTIDFGRRASRPVGTVFEESIRTAQLIYEEHGEPTIQFSGGMDSELVVSACRHAGIPFRCFIMQYENEINSHDVSDAVAYCQAYGLKYDIYDIDVLKFLQSSEAEDYVRQSQTKQAAFSLFFKGMREIDGFVLHGGGEPVIECQNDPELEAQRIYSRRWVSWEHERYYAGLKFMMYHKINGVPCFYQYTPEMWLSIFKDKYVQRMVRNQYSRSVVKSEDIKHMTNEGHRPKLRIKHTGFERILDVIWDRCNELNNAAAFYCNDDWTMPYGDVLTALDYQP